jgi:hypothetical protein
MDVEACGGVGNEANSTIAQALEDAEHRLDLILPISFEVEDSR